MTKELKTTSAVAFELTSVDTAHFEATPPGSSSEEYCEDIPLTTDSQHPRRKYPSLRQWIAAIIVNMLYLADVVGFYATLDYSETVYDDEDDIPSIWSSIMESMFVAGILSFVLHFIILLFLQRKFHIFIICIFYCGTALAKMYLDIYKSYISHYFIMILWAVASTGTRMLVTVYINETTINCKRGRLIAVKTFFGYLVHTLEIYEYPLFRYSWDMLAIALVVSLACLWLPESPVYFLRQGNVDAAKQSLRRLQGNTSDLEDDIKKLQTLLKSTHSDTNNTIATIRRFSNIRILGYSGLVIILCLLEFLSGDIFAEYNMNHQLDRHLKGQSLIKLFVFFVIFILGITTGLMVCEHLGHRKTLLASVVLCSVALFLNGMWYWKVGMYWYTNVIGFLLAALHLFGYSVGVSFLPTVITIDIFPPSILNFLLAITGIITWPLYADISIYLKVYEHNTLHVFLLPLAAGCAVSVTVFFFFLPDTTDLSVGALLSQNREENMTDPNNEHL